MKPSLTHPQWLLLCRVVEEGGMSDRDYGMLSRAQRLAKKGALIADDRGWWNTTPQAVPMIEAYWRWLFADTWRCIGKIHVDVCARRAAGLWVEPFSNDAL